MPVLQGKCKECIGCNRLEDINFSGIYRCENYVKGVKYGKEQNDKKRT